MMNVFHKEGRNAGKDLRGNVPPSLKPFLPSCLPNKKYFVFALLILFSSGFLSIAQASDTDIADSWSAIVKGLGKPNDTDGVWTEYTMPDSDAQGRRYIDLFLVPGATVEFKAIFDPAGNKKYEKDFASSSGRRTLVVPTSAATVLMNWSDTPDAPSGLTAYADSGRVTLKWSHPTGDGNLDVSNGGGYFLYYDTGPAFDTWVRFSNDTIYGTEFVCTSLVNDSIYYFSLRSFDAYRDTVLTFSNAYSDSIQVTPGTPASISFRVYMGEMSVDTAYVSFDSGAGFSDRRLTREGTSRWYGDTFNMPRGYTFPFKFSRHDTAGTKHYEFPVSAGRKHMFVYPHAVGVNTVNVKGSWDWGTTTNLTLYSDSFWRGDANISNPGVYEYGFTLNGTSWKSDPANPYLTGSNSLIGVDATPHSSTMRYAKLPDTGIAQIMADWEDTPYTPTGFLAMPNTNNTVLLSWTSASQAEDVDSYKIEYTEVPTDSNGWILLVTTNHDSTSFRHTGIIPGDTYYYRISTVDYYGNASPYKNFASANASNQKEIFFLIRKFEAEIAPIFQWARRIFLGTRQP